jgi:hypothetical protein
MAEKTEDSRIMQDGKPINAVILQRCINLFLLTLDKDFLTLTTQNTTEKQSTNSHTRQNCTS